MVGSPPVLTPNDAARARSLRWRQALVISLLFGGYGSLYFCRADLSVATPLLVDALRSRGIGHDEAIIRIGGIASLGVLAYGFGKFFLAGLGDVWGGRASFLAGLVGATVFTLLFASGLSLPLFTLAWFGNRLIQSMSWAGLIKVSSKWFDHSSYGLIIGLLSLSYLVGDAVARQWMGMLIDHGFGWQALFYLAGGTAAFFLLINGLLLRESRVEAGFAEATVNPLNLYADAPGKAPSVRELLRPLLSSRAFWLVCLLSLGCTVIREAFNLWIPAYLRDYAGYAPSAAARMSAVFPAVGAASVLTAGWLSDRLGIHGRPLLLTAGLCGTTAALMVLRALPGNGAVSWLVPAAIGAVAFCLLGPYSFLGGAMALDFGGKRAGALSSGIIDGVGYLGASVAGDGIARLSVHFGWSGVYAALAATSALASVASGRLYWVGKAAATSGRHLP